MLSISIAILMVHGHRWQSNGIWTPEYSKISCWYDASVAFEVFWYIWWSVLPPDAKNPCSFWTRLCTCLVCLYGWKVCILRPSVMSTSGIWCTSDRIFMIGFLCMTTFFHSCFSFRPTFSYYLSLVFFFEKIYDTVEFKYFQKNVLYLFSAVYTSYRIGSRFISDWELNICQNELNLFY